MSNGQNIDEYGVTEIETLKIHIDRAEKFKNKIIPEYRDCYLFVSFLKKSIYISLIFISIIAIYVYYYNPFTDRDMVVDKASCKYDPVTKTHLCHVTMRNNAKCPPKGRKLVNGVEKCILPAKRHQLPIIHGMITITILCAVMIIWYYYGSNGPYFYINGCLLVILILDQLKFQQDYIVDSTK